MQCPNCFAQIPEDSLRCPQCEINIPGEKRSYPGDKISPPPDSGEPDYPVSLMEAILRPFNLGRQENLMSLLYISFVNFIPILGQIVLAGYYAEYVRQIIYRRGSRHLPPFTFSFDRIINFAGKGINFFVAMVVYAIGLGIINTAVIIPFWGTIIAVTANSSRGGDLSPAGCMAILTAIVVPVFLITLISIAYSMVVQIVFIIYSAGNLRLSDAFKIVPAVNLIFSDLGNYFLDLLVIYLLGLVAGALSTATSVLLSIPIIGWIGIALLNTVLYMLLGLVTVSVFSEFYYKNQSNMSL